MVYVPKGFAHGFLTTSLSADVIYRVSGYYAPEYDMCINWNDPDLNINWNIDRKDLILTSSKDGDAPNLNDIMGIL